jgi:hypothetical protein
LSPTSGKGAFGRSSAINVSEIRPKLPVADQSVSGGNGSVICFSIDTDNG